MSAFRLMVARHAAEDNFGDCSAYDIKAPWLKLTWGRIHVDFVGPFSFVRTFLRFTLTIVSYFPRSVCEVKKIGIHVDILTKIWYSRRLRKNFPTNFVQASLGTPILGDANINDIFFFIRVDTLKQGLPTRGKFPPRGISGLQGENGGLPRIYIHFAWQ